VRGGDRTTAPKRGDVVLKNGLVDETLHSNMAYRVVATRRRFYLA